MRILRTRLSHYNEVALPMMATKYHWQVQGNFTTHICNYLGYDTPVLTRKNIRQVIKVFEDILSHKKTIEEVISA